MLVSTDKNKDTPKIYAEIWDEIKDLIRSITNPLVIMTKNISKSNLIQMTICLQIKY